MKNNAILIQHAYDHHLEFVDMMRLTYQRHAAYCKAHGFDYWHMLSDIPGLNVYRGAWSKVVLIEQALEAGYQTVVWIDCDAAVANMDCDLREAIPTGAGIAACIHDPANSQFLQAMQIPAHYNVGVLYVNQIGSAFIRDWFSRREQELQRFMEQDIFNGMAKEEQYAGIVARADDTWNATINVNMAPLPNVLGWHGIWPNARRVAMMREALKDDFLKFRV